MAPTPPPVAVSYARHETHKARLMRTFPAQAIPTPMNELVDTPTISVDRSPLQSVAFDVMNKNKARQLSGPAVLMI